jgi:hypothetical protein
MPVAQESAMSFSPIALSNLAKANLGRTETPATQIAPLPYRGTHDRQLHTHR